MPNPSAPSNRARVRRAPARGAYDRATIDAILDDTLISHVGFVHDEAPVVIPMLHARDADTLYLHGSSASRLMKLLAKGAHACATATAVDGLVLARSAFHHSINYRSVVVFGEAVRVPDTELGDILELFTEKLVPGRWPHVRQPTRQELKGTMVLGLPIAEASAKLRTGPPIDDDEDYDLPVWAGVLPLRTVVDPPEPDPRLHEGTQLPAHVAEWRP